MRVKVADTVKEIFFSLNIISGATPCIVLNTVQSSLLLRIMYPLLLLRHVDDFQKYLVKIHIDDLGR